MRPPASHPWWLAGVAASAGAGVIHLTLGPEHVAELGALGYGFYLSAALQLGWAALLGLVLARFGALATPRNLRLLAISGIAINGAILVAWAVSRLVGLPAGEVPWTPEAIGRSDTIAGAVEGALIVGLGASLQGWSVVRSRPPRKLGTAGAVLAMALIATGTAAAIEPGAGSDSHGAGQAHGSGVHINDDHQQVGARSTDPQASDSPELSQRPPSDQPAGVATQPSQGTASDAQPGAAGEPSHGHDDTEPHGH